MIFGIWVAGVGSNLLGAQQVSMQQMCAGAGAVDPPWFVLLMPPLMFVGWALFAKRPPFYAPWLAALIDERAGAGSFEGFVIRLKPLLLLAAAGLSSALGLALQCRRAGLGGFDAGGAAFMLSAGLAFALAHVVMRWRRLPGI